MKLIVVDDSMLIREGVSTMLTRAGHQVVAALDAPDRVLAMVRQHQPAVVILDIRMPPTYTDEGLRLASTLRRGHPQVGVLVLSQYVVGEYAAWLLERAPVRVGYLLKDAILHAEVLDQALVRIAEGGTVVDPAIAHALVESGAGLLDLTAREFDVLRLMAEGLSDKGIADRLRLSLHTVATHVRHIFTRLALPGGPEDNRRVQAVVTYLAAQRFRRGGSPD